VTSPSLEVGDTVFIRTGPHKGKIGTLATTKVVVGLDSYSQLGTVLLPDGSLLGPFDVNELERTDSPPDAD
jgi:hypothetical protein